MCATSARSNAGQMDDGVPPAHIEDSRVSDKLIGTSRREGGEELEPRSALSHPAKGASYLSSQKLPW